MEDRLQSVPLGGETHDPDATAPFPGAAALDSGATLLVGGTLLQGDDDLGEDEAPLDLQDLLGVKVADVIAGRYTITEHIGRGGFGNVWKARVGETKEHVAVKIVRLHNDNERRLVRREVAALRWARLPGVVRLLDDGTHGRDYFIVMEKAPGKPFPGARAPLSWPELKPRALHLLEILARVHLSGLIHRDLKPQNILVDDDGRCTLLDLGIAAGRALHHSDPAFAFTPHYAAPEQRTRGGVTDERTDLYAFGVLLVNALTGSLPHKLDHPLHDHPDIPAEVAAVIARLLEPSPADRYASTLEVIDALGGQLPPFLGGGALDFLPRDRPATADELRPLFHGPELFFHFPEDAANELWRRTGGHIEHIEAELGAWLRAGIAYWDKTAIRITREAIERLQSGLRVRIDPPGNLPKELAEIFDVIALCAPYATPELICAYTERSPQTVHESLNQLQALRLCWPQSNRFIGCPIAPTHQKWSRSNLRKLKQATLPHIPENSAVYTRFKIDTTKNSKSLIEYLIHRARTQLRLGEQEESLFLLNQIDLLNDDTNSQDIQALVLWCIWSFRSHKPSSIENALVRIDRLSEHSTILKHIKTLLRSTMLCLQKQFERALFEINKVPALEDPDLEEWRVTMLMKALSGTRNSPLWTSTLLKYNTWSQHSARRRAIYLGWLGTAEQISSNYAKAARQHNEAAELKQNHQSKMSSLANAANSYMDALNFERSIQLAQEITAFTGIRRDPYRESRAAWIIRTSKYRRDPYNIAPAPDILEASKNITTYPLFAVTEAAILWRQGRIPDALHLVKQAQRTFKQPGLSHTLEAFAMYITNDYSLSKSQYIQKVLDSEIPDMIVQSISIICFFHPTEHWLKILQTNMMSRPRSEWGVTLDFFSYDECNLLSQGVLI